MDPQKLLGFSIRQRNYLVLVISRRKCLISIQSTKQLDFTIDAQKWTIVSIVLKLCRPRGRGVGGGRYLSTFCNPRYPGITFTEKCYIYHIRSRIYSSTAVKSEKKKKRILAGTMLCPPECTAVLGQVTGEPGKRHTSTLSRRELDWFDWWTQATQGNSQRFTLQETEKRKEAQQKNDTEQKTGSETATARKHCEVLRSIIQQGGTRPLGY